MYCGKSPYIGTCGSEILEPVTVPETFLVPLCLQYLPGFAQLAMTKADNAISYSRFASSPSSRVAQMSLHLGKNKLKTD